MKVNPTDYQKYLMDIKGKGYMSVEGRLAMCRDDHAAQGATFDIITEYLGEYVVRAMVKSPLYGTTTGLSQNHPNPNGHTAQDTNPIEDAETSAVGRALGFMGYGLTGNGIASANEVKGAVARQAARNDVPASNESPSDTGFCEECGAVAKHIPAGISKKTNKPYKAFYVCETCGHKQWSSGRTHAEPEQPATVEEAEKLFNDAPDGVPQDDVFEGN